MNPEIDKYGNKKWYNKDKQLHRTDGPAVEYSVGTKVWYLNGKSHRTDGPAIEYADGTKVWLLNDKELSEELHKELTECSLKDLPLILNKGFDDFIAERLKNEH